MKFRYAEYTTEYGQFWIVDKLILGVAWKQVSKWLYSEEEAKKFISFYTKPKKDLYTYITVESK